MKLTIWPSGRVEIEGNNIADILELHEKYKAGVSATPEVAADRYFYALANNHTTWRLSGGRFAYRTRGIPQWNLMDNTLESIQRSCREITRDEEETYNTTPLARQ